LAFGFFKDRHNLSISCPEIRSKSKAAKYNNQKTLAKDNNSSYDNKEDDDMDGGTKKINFAPCHRLKEVAHLFRKTRILLEKQQQKQQQQQQQGEEYNLITEKIFDIEKNIAGTCRDQLSFKKKC
jgi:SPX domain protein involved in polyphosphate accumulation